MPSSSDFPGEIDKIPYDAPLPFDLPAKEWTEAKGGRPNNRTETLTEADVPPVDLTGKWILISGANNGIGKEAALTFASWGANLILACKDPRATEGHPLEAVDGCKARAKANGHTSTIEWWKYDAADLASVEALAQRWLDTGRPLDILCNNAGVASTPAGNNAVFKTKDGFEFIFQINLLSHILLTLRLLPSLAKAEAPRVICTTSCFHYLGKYPFTNWNGGYDEAGPDCVQFYKNSKLYFQIWLTELQHRLLQHEEYKHITVNGFHPGYVASGIWISQDNTWLLWLIRLISLLLRFMASIFGINVKQGSMGMVYIATAPECGPDPKTQGGRDERGKGGGRYFNRIWEDEAMPHCRDRDARLRVWRKVNEDLKLQDKGLLDVLGLYSGET